MKEKPIHWSHSVLQSYDTCPFKHYMTKVTKKVQVVYGPEANQGIVTHGNLEDRLQKQKPLVDKEVAYEFLCKALENSPGKLYPEVNLVLTKEFKKTHGKDWDHAWLRNTIDVLKIHQDKAVIVDWKTGKVKNDFSQLDLSAAVVFTLFPQIQEVSAAFIWLKNVTNAGKKVAEEDSLYSPIKTYRREELPKLWEKFLSKYVTYSKAYMKNNWPCKTSGLCKNYCEVNKAGLCPEF